MKNYIFLILALLMVLSLCACSQQAEPVETPTTAEVINTMPPTTAEVINTMPPTEAPTEAPAAAAGVVNFGDVIENESIIMSIETAEIKKELKYQHSSNFSSSMFIEEGKQAFCLMGNIENVGGYEIDEWAFSGTLVIDDKYNYDLRMWCPSDLEPLVETPYFLYAEIPEKLVDSYTTATFTFGFNNDFETTFGETEDLDNLFTITVSK